MAHVQEIYGSMVFNEHVMKERLPKETYKSLVKTVREGKPLECCCSRYEGVGN